LKIRIAPEAELIMDPFTSVISKDKTVAPNRSKSALIQKLDETERAVDGLMNSLNPDKALLNSWRGREKTSVSAGKITNFFYGLVVGLILSGVALIVLSLLFGGF
jgi:tetrahydromethanopterin S-methyltransferase subunit B